MVGVVLYGFEALTTDEFSNWNLKEKQTKQLKSKPIKRVNWQLLAQ